MTAYSGKDLARSFRTVRGNTIQIARDLPQDQWTFRPAPGARSAAELLAHIAALTITPRRINILDRPKTLAPADFGPYGAETAAFEHSLTTPAAILQALETTGEEFAKELEALSSEELAERQEFSAPIQPSSKTRFELLLGAKEHEMHHRGQLMLMQRMLGVVPHLTREREARMRAHAPAPSSTT
jgi:uncharacterized damage-inducible protein DinB